jgi:AraC-like DNA-binding protein
MHRSPPDVDARLYGPQRIDAIVTTLAEDRISPAPTLDGSGLDEAALRDSATRVSYRQVSTVFRNAVRLATDPATAFRAGTRMHLTKYGMYGYGLLSSPTHAEQVDFAIKYNPVMGPVAGPVAYSVEGEVAVYTYDVLLAADPAEALYGFALEFAYAAHLTLGRDLSGSAYSMLGLRAASPAPAHAELLTSLFGCPVQFDSLKNEIAVDRRWASFDHRMPDPVTHAGMRELCEQLLADRTRTTGVASMVRRTLVKQMPWRFPTIDTMAEAIAIHPRTLRRRLEAEGTTYKDLLSDVRRRLAVEYLQKTRMTTEEIASRLGYSDAANFRHAFARWTGRTPSEYRTA